MSDKTTPKKTAKQMALPLTFAEAGNWFAPVKRIKVDDRNYLLQMGKPVQIGSSYDVAKATGIGRRILKRLAKLGFIREIKPSPFLSMYYYTDVIEFMQKTEEDPDFWNYVRREAYLKGERLTDATAK